MAYTPVAARKETKKTGGYTPVAARVQGTTTSTTPKLTPTPNNLLQFAPSFRTQTSTAAVDTMAANPIIDVPKTILQGTARGLAGLGAEVKETPRRIVEGVQGKTPTVPMGDAKFPIPTDDSLFAKAQRAAFGRDTAFSLRTEGTIPGFIEEGNPAAPIVGMIFGVLDLAGGGGAKNVFKAISAADNFNDAAKIGRQIGIEENLLKDFADSAVSAKTTKEAEEVVNSFAKLQQTTKGYTPVAQRGKEGVSALKADTSVPFDGTVYRGEGKNTGTKNILEFGKANYVTTRKDYASNYGEVSGFQLSPNAKLLDAEAPAPPDAVNAILESAKGVYKQNVLDLIKENPSATFRTVWKRATELGRDADEVNAALKNAGYDGIEFRAGKMIGGKEFPSYAIFNDARLSKSSPSIPKELEPLAKEARKYGSAKEFEPALRSQYKDLSKKLSDALNAEDDAVFATVKEQLGAVNNLMRDKSKLTDFYKKATSAANPVSGDTSGTAVELSPRERLSQMPQTVAASPSAREGIDTLSTQSPKSQNASLAGRLEQDTQLVKQLPETIYSENRANFVSSKTSRIRITNLKGGGRPSVGKGLDILGGAISTRLKNIDPSLKKAIRDFEFKLATNTQKDRTSIAPFLKAVRSKDIGMEDYADLDLALKNSDTVRTKEIIEKYNLQEEFAKVRATLDDLYKRAEEVGYEIGFRQDYFPRKVADSDGFLEYLQKGDDWSIIEAAIKEKEAGLAGPRKYLTTDEKVTLINNLLRGYGGDKIKLSKTGAMKSRQVDVVDAGLNQFYLDSVESIIRYVDETNEAIEARRFFGKSIPKEITATAEESIGNYTLKLLAEGKIKPSQEIELRDILQARFSPKGTTWSTNYKNLAYIDTMGSFTSALTQIGDLGMALYKGGPTQTVRAFGKAIAGKSEITRADIGIEKIAQEFQDRSRTAEWVDKVFRVIGLHKMDALGKETVINATIGRMREQAKNPDAYFMRNLEAVFGNDTPKVLDDLKEGRVTENVKLLAFNELLDVQPVALSEMPEQYLKGGNGRLFYMLKSYTLKLIDVYRNDVFQQMKEDPVRGLRNLMALSASLVAMNATADELKDLLLNRETSLSDRVIDNILKLAGFNKFTVYKAREEGAGSALLQMILPPMKFPDAFIKDVMSGNIEQTIESIPIGGKLYYWWFGKGAEKSEKKRAENDQGDFPAMPEAPPLPELPPLPKLPKLPNI